MNARTITFSAGTTYYLKFTVNYSDDWSVLGKRGTPVLAAEVSSAKFLVKKAIGTEDADADLTKTTASGITVANGLVTVSIAAADSDDLQGKYYATLRLYLVGGGVQDFEDSDYNNIPFVILNVLQGAVEAIS